MSVHVACFAREVKVGVCVHLKFPVSVASHICVCLQVPGLCEDLLSSVDQPLKIARDKVVEKDYLLCDYNRDGDSYRSIS